MSRMLVVYYSWSNGNTKRIAEQLANRTGADIARIETVQPYTGAMMRWWTRGSGRSTRAIVRRFSPLV